MHTWRLLTILGRLGIVAVPVGVLFAVEGELWSASGLAWAFAVTVVFSASLQAARSATAKELLALRPPMAAMRGTAIGFVAVSALGLWADGLGVSLLGLALCALAIFALMTSLAPRIEPRRNRRRRLLVVGAGTGVHDLIEEIRLAPGRFTPVGIVDDTDARSCAGVPVLGRLDDLARVIEAERPEIVVLGVERNRPTIFRHLLDSAPVDFRVVELAQFYEHAFGRVPVRDLTRAWFMSVLHLYRRPYSRGANRAFDLAAAALGLVMALPLLLMTPFLILTTRGPVIVRQTRLGEHGRPFTMYKFRTMRSDAEEPGLPIWAVERDPRATTTGRLMRRFRLDEIPQLWNVIRGEMSIVGPRPERPEFLAQLQEDVPFWERRHLIKPGITGWAQVRRGYTADTAGSMEKLSFDLWYLRHRSLGVDFAICMLTIGVLIRGGAPTTVRAGAEERLRTSPYASLLGRLRASGGRRPVATVEESGHGSRPVHEPEERAPAHGSSIRAESS